MQVRDDYDGCNDETPSSVKLTPVRIVKASVLKTAAARKGEQNSNLF